MVKRRAFSSLFQDPTLLVWKRRQSAIWSDAALRIGGVWYRSLQGHLQTKGEWAPKEAGVGSVNVTFVGPCVPTLSMKWARGRSINVQYTCTEPGTKTVKYTETMKQHLL